MPDRGAKKTAGTAGNEAFSCSRPAGWTDEAIRDVAGHMDGNYETLEFLRLSQFGAWRAIREEYPGEAKMLDAPAATAALRSKTQGLPKEP